MIKIKWLLRILKNDEKDKIFLLKDNGFHANQVIPSTWRDLTPCLKAEVSGLPTDITQVSALHQYQDALNTAYQLAVNPGIHSGVSIKKTCTIQNH